MNLAQNKSCDFLTLVFRKLIILTQRQQRLTETKAFNNRLSYHSILIKIAQTNTMELMKATIFVRCVKLISDMLLSSSSPSNAPCTNVVLAAAEHPAYTFLPQHDEMLQMPTQPLLWRGKSGKNSPKI